MSFNFHSHTGNEADNLNAYSTNSQHRICTTLPFKIGEYVHIGSDCIVQAASIGICVVIGDDCIIVS